MKKLVFVFFLSVFATYASAQTTPEKAQSAVIQNKTVEIACGECKFKMTGKSCDLAVRINGKPYFVDGKSIDDFGDAHDKKHGFCNAISKAKVSGEIINYRFKAKTIEIIPAKKD